MVPALPCYVQKDPFIKPVINGIGNNPNCTKVMKKTVRCAQDVRMPVRNSQLTGLSTILINTTFRRKVIMSINITSLLLFFGCMQLSARSLSQTVDFKGDAKSLTEVFAAIEEQTGYLVIYNSKIIKTATPITIKAKDMPLNEFLNRILKPQALKYTINEKTILVTRIWDSHLPASTQQIAIQQREITGSVTNTSGEPLGGVTVSLKGSNLATQTNDDGGYRLELPLGYEGSLIFTIVGYETLERSIGNASQLNVSLTQAISDLDEVVVVGYGTQRRQDLTGAVASVGSEEIGELSTTRIDQALLGRVAGVQVKPVSGEPGAAQKIMIRGIGSISAGGDPLYVVDGFPTDNIQAINPNDVESMDILKDASATAIYGSRGANGVVIINTKRGTAGQSRFGVDLSYGIQEVAKIPEFKNALEQAEWAYHAVRNRNLDLGNDISGPEENWDFPVPKTVLDVLAGTNSTDVNAIQELLQVAPMRQVRLNASGGTDNVRYALSGEYLNQDGVLINTGFERYSVRANIDAKLSEKLTVKMNLNPTYTNQWGHDPSGTGYGTSILGNAASINPYNPLLDADNNYFIFRGLPEVGDFPNPLALANEIVSRRRGPRFMGNINAEYSILDELKLNVLLGANTYSTKSMEFVPHLPSLLNSSASGTDDVLSTFNWITEYTLNYNKDFGLHHLEGLAGFTAQQERGESNFLESNRYPNNLIPTLSAVGGLLNDGSSDIYEWSLVSYLGRLNYNYNSKYYVTASFRTDGSSRFGSERKYGIFPSFSLAWRLSDEAFMENIGFLDDLKLRGGYGETGNNNIGNYEHLATVVAALYPLGNEPTPGYTSERLPNSILTWEKQRSFNVGLDAAFFNNRLMVTIDHFRSKNTDLLLNVNVPNISGFSTALQNIGEVHNKGWEFEISSNNLSEGFQWTTDLNLSMYENEVAKLGPKGDPIISNTHITMIGQPIGMFYGLLTDGIFRNQAELEQGPIHSPGSTLGSHVGDIRYVDLSGPDGTPDGIIDSYDRTVMGSPYPDLYYGMTNRFSYKNFNLSISLQGVSGNKVLSEAKRVSMRGEFRVNQLAVLDDFWKSEQEPGRYPRPNDEPTGGLRDVSQRYLDEGTYLRINNIVLGYVFTEKVTQALKLQSLGINLTATNPFLFTKNLGFNPDVNNGSNALAPGVDNNNYPLARTFLLGVNIGF